jgi:cob(I)alamin adenosyltransferase
MKAKKDNKENILYTGVGDDGTTTLFHCNQQRISKSENVIEALGALDELNAYLGIVKVYSVSSGFSVEFPDHNVKYKEIIGDIQQNLFVIQAELAGSNMGIEKAP